MASRLVICKRERTWRGVVASESSEEPPLAFLLALMIWPYGAFAVIRTDTFIMIKSLLPSDCFAATARAEGRLSNKRLAGLSRSKRSYIGVALESRYRYHRIPDSLNLSVRFNCLC